MDFLSEIISGCQKNWQPELALRELDGLDLRFKL
jgi:hypothetical protein